MTQCFGVVVLVCISAAFAGVLSIAACGAGGLNDGFGAVVTQRVNGIGGVLIPAGAGVYGISDLRAGGRNRFGNVCMFVSRGAVRLRLRRTLRRVLLGNRA